MAPALAIAEGQSLVMPKRSLPMLSAPPATPRPPAGTELRVPSISFHKHPPAMPAAAIAAEPCARELYGSAVTGGYLNCALLMGLAHVLTPHRQAQALLVFSPLWAATLLLHAAAVGGARGCLGAGLAMGLPSAILIDDATFSVAYIAAFAAFASDRDDRGLWLAFQAGCLCAMGAGLAGFAFRHERAGLHVASFAVVVLAMIGSRRFGGLRYKVVPSRPANDLP